METTYPPQAPAGPRTGTPAGPAGPGRVVAGARGVLDELDDVLWAARRPEELLEVVAELERTRSRLAALEARVTVEIEATSAAKTDGWSSTTAYLTAITGSHRCTGPRMLRTARALTTDLSATHHALHQGTISPEHADAIVWVMARLPRDPDLRQQAEQLLLDEATRLNATELRDAVHALLELLDPDGAAREEEKALERHERSAHLQRHLSLTDDGLGGVRLKGRGTTEDAAVIKAALAGLAAPTAADLADSDPECGDPGRDTRDHGARTWDALVEACQRLQDTHTLPESHGIKPRIQVTIGLDQLRTGLGTALLDTGDRLCAAAVRKLACDADLIPAVLGTHGEILDVGRAARLVTTAIWTALVLRDRHCAFPGCRRPPRACDAHHLIHWADGGPTSLDNLALLCRAHHTLIHATPWQIRLHPRDRRPEFKPPPARHRHPAEPPPPQRWIRDRTARE